MEKERQMVIPGETIVSGNEFLPGDGAYRSGTEVVSERYGISNISEKHVRVIPVSGAYYPRRGNTIIGTIADITFNGWLIDFGGALLMCCIFDGFGCAAGALLIFDVLRIPQS